MMELLLDIVWLAVTELLVWRRATIFDFTSDASERDGWWSGLVGLANLDKIKAVNTFLEAIDRITKVLCSLLLRTCSKDTGATWIGQTTFGGETGPTSASQGHGDTIKQSFLKSNEFVTLQYGNQTSHAAVRLAGRSSWGKDNYPRPNPISNRILQYTIPAKAHSIVQ